MISFEQIQKLGHIFDLERRYINEYGALFHNFAYRETSTVFVLQQTVEPTAEIVPGRHGVDAKAEEVGLKAIELKSANVSHKIHIKPNLEKYKGLKGQGHYLSHSSLVGKFDKMHSDNRYERVKQYDAFAFSIFSNRHLPEVVFYIKHPNGVLKIQNMIDEQRKNIFNHSDTGSFKGTTIDIKYESVFNCLTNDELYILVDHNYVDDSNEDIKYTQITKQDYLDFIVGSEMPKGNLFYHFS